MRPPTLIDELLAYLFDGQPHPLTPTLTAWLNSSRRFTAFANTYRDKIRKKLRVHREPAALQDLRLELETAYLLYREPALSLAYEAQPCGQERCPDFAVSFTTRLTFMLEVTRLRALHKPADATPAAPPVGERIAETMCGKLGQMLPQRGNVLVVGVDAPLPSLEDLQAAMIRIQQRAEQNDARLLRPYQFRDRAGFFRHLQRLSEVLVRGSQLEPGEPPVVWANPQAKYPLPAKVGSALERSHTL